uniref:Putative ovule protein n=1 Tax=Solanum chacoense TaxID=4108 RepID=A0A0V0GSM4_SOLCH
MVVFFSKPEGTRMTVNVVLTLVFILSLGGTVVPDVYVFYCSFFKNKDILSSDMFVFFIEIGRNKGNSKCCLYPGLRSFTKWYPMFMLLLFFKIKFPIAVH